jgi:putative ABC transport system permease protein
MPRSALHVAPRWRKVLRDVWLHRSRTLLVILAIIVGIVGAGAVLDAWSLLRRVTNDEFRASNPASATFTTTDVDATLLARVRELPAVRDVQARRQIIGRAFAAVGRRTAILFVFEDFTDVTIGILKPESGAWPPADGALVIEASSVEFAGIAVGDSIGIQIGDGAPRTLPVTGIARDVGLAPGWMEHVVYGFVTRATLQMLGTSPALDELQIVVADSRLDRNGVRRVAADVKSIIEASGRAVSHVDVPEPGRHIHAAQIGSLLFTQGAFGVLSLLLSGILVVNLIGAMLTSQVREIGVMKAIGAGGRQIAAMYLGMAGILGLLASAVALPVAAILGRMYAQLTADMLNFDITGFTIPAPVIWLQLLVGVLLPVVAASIPVVQGCRISVAQALRDVGIDAGRTGGRGMRLLLAAGPARPLLLSLRNAFRRRQRMVLTLMALSVGGAVYVGALNLRASILRSVGYMFSSQRYDLGLRFERPCDPDSLESAVASIVGVAKVEAWGATRAGIAATDDALGNQFSIAAPPAGSQLFVPKMRNGRWLEAGDERALVVNRRLAKDEPALAVGNEVTLLVGGQPVRWRVVGEVETGPGPAAYTLRQTLADVFGDARVDRAVVTAAVRGSASQLDLVQRLRTELNARGLPVQSSQLKEQSRKVTEDHLIMVADFLGVMSYLMIVVGGLALASTMSLSVLERTREIGVLRAIGARHGAILAIVQVEGLVVGLLSWLVALPLSVPMSVVLGRAFGNIMLPVPVQWTPEPTGVLRWLLVVVVVSLVACGWPAFRATRIPTAAALAYE